MIKTILVHADADLAEPEVCDLDVSLLVEHHVVQLEVPVEDPVLVKIQQGDADLCSIKPAEQRLIHEDNKPFTHVATGSLNFPDC